MSFVLKVSDLRKRDKSQFRKKLADKLCAKRVGDGEKVGGASRN